MAIVTISRAPFSGVEELAAQLAKEMGYGLLSREELLANSGEEFGASHSQLEAALSHTPGFLEGRGLKKLHYIYCVQATMAKAVQGDNIVYHGEAGHLLLKGVPHRMRVRIIASMEARIEIAVEQANLTRAKAIDYLEALDVKQNGWMQWVHGVEARDPRTYDMTLNLERISAARARAIIAETAATDFQTTPDSQKMMDDLVVASEVRARIGLAGNIADDRLTISADDGVVTITAGVRNMSSAVAAKELAVGLADVREVRTIEDSESS